MTDDPTTGTLSVLDDAVPGWPAYLLTLAVPGLGHGYLGQWRRALAWFAIYAVTVGFLSARRLLVERPGGHPLFGTAFEVGSVPPGEVLLPLAIIGACLIDVYLLRLARSE